MTIGVEETTVSVLMEEKVYQLEEKFILAVSIHLKVHRKCEAIIEGMAMRVALHEEPLNVGLIIHMLLAMVDLL